MSFEIEFGLMPKDLECRNIAYKAFRRWVTEGKDFQYEKKNGITVLSELLGKSVAELHHNMTDRDRELCVALGGPNGWAIYKALKARQNEEG